MRVQHHGRGGQIGEETLGDRVLEPLEEAKTGEGVHVAAARRAPRQVGRLAAVGAQERLVEMPGWGPR